MRLLKHVLLFLILTGLLVTSIVVWRIQAQGLKVEQLPPYVTVDRHGIPTVTAKDWPTLIERQGFVVASDRLWQMDLLRRIAAGRLSEWFGQATVENDVERVKEDWLGVADRAAKNLPKGERVLCDAYARGVNRFIKSASGRWALEYELLLTEPEPWSCRDSLLVVLHMSQTLTSNVKREIARTHWRDILTDEWFQFLFPNRHPWAQPMFGEQREPELQLPPRWQALPQKTFRLSGDGIIYENEYVKGSNAWVWTSSRETLLAGDPHLKHSVPQVWYAMRLKITPQDWVVGAALPGIPGIVIGMNDSFAWSFTNTGDDQDDVLIETLDTTAEHYLAYKEGDREAWRRLFVKNRRIKVRNAEDHVVEVKWTHRGPVIGSHEKSNKVMVRQWSALKPGVLGLPVVALNQATTFAEMNQAIDRMGAPSQSIVYADRAGRIGYRATGISVSNTLRSDLLKDALSGEWTDFGSTQSRPRVLLEPEEQRKFIVNANAQIWVDDQPHHWASDDRRQRIVEMLGEMKTASVEVFQSLQLDVHSRFHRELVGWVLASYPDRADQNWRTRLKAWNGYADSDPAVFTFAIWAERNLLKSLVARVVAKFADAEDPLVYRHRLDRAWLLELFGNSQIAQIFGTSNKEIVAVLTESWIRQRSSWELMDYQSQNRLIMRHPFEGRLPLLGMLFQVKKFPQVGFRDLVRAESGERGPSLRLVFDLRNIKNSTWSFPVGQSGHIRSKHYRDWQGIWRRGNQVPVFEATEEWR